jgi:hypothetical protein
LYYTFGWLRKYTLNIIKHPINKVAYIINNTFKNWFFNFILFTSVLL